MDTPTLVLDYLKVLLSTPPVVGIVAIVFIATFRKQLGGLIDRAWKIKFPGGELSASQQDQTRTGPTLPSADAKQLPAPDVTLPSTIQVTPDQSQQIVRLIQSERANAALWEYRYLNYYLVRTTQLVLEWLAAQPQPVSMRLLDSFLQAPIPDANERTAIVTALQNHHLIALKADALTVTPKGREYLQWRGPLPPMSGLISTLKCNTELHRA